MIGVYTETSFQKTYASVIKKTDKDIKKENHKNPFLVFKSYTLPFSICSSEISNKLAFSVAHIENSLTA